jgi:recombinational DNA repair protein RecT
MKKIHIQDLERKLLKNTILQFNLNRIVTQKEEQGCYENLYDNRVYAKYTNGESVASFPNNFIGAYLHAYNNHQDIIFSPCDIWLQIQLMVADYIDKNAEALRDKIVAHEGKKKLVVIEYVGSVEESLIEERKWDYFFQQIKPQIDANTKNNVVSALAVSDFSTATNIQNIFSTACIMSSFKQYFSYSRCLMLCGIPNVYFEGTREDWVTLKTKIAGLSIFALDKPATKFSITTYVQKLLPLADKFIETFDGNNIDVDFWNNIMTTNVKRIGSGGDTQTTMEGWITYFIGEYGKISFEDVTSNKMVVPIELENKLTGTIKNLTLYGCFTGVVHNADINAYRPQLGLVLYHHDENFVKVVTERRHVEEMKHKEECEARKKMLAERKAKLNEATQKQHELSAKGRNGELNTKFNDIIEKGIVERTAQGYADSSQEQQQMIKEHTKAENEESDEEDELTKLRKQIAEQQIEIENLREMLGCVNRLKELATSSFK